MVVDASILLSALFPDESQLQAQQVIRDHVTKQVMLVAPTLLSYEVANAVWQGVRRQRITSAQAEEILTAVGGLEIGLEAVSWQTAVPFAQRFDRSVYDAAYLGLAHARQEQFITGDLRLYNAVKAESDWVLWLGDYRT